MIDKIKIGENYSEYEKINVDDYLLNTNLVNKELSNFLSGQTKHGYSTGNKTLDNHFVFKENEFYVMTAKKGIGKTSLNQALQVMGSLVNGLIWVVCFMENSAWSMKLGYLNYYLGDAASDVMKTNPKRYNEALKWVEKHFIFLEVESIKQAVEVTKLLIEEKGIKVHGLLLDPINSFINGWQDTGNSYADGVVASIKLLKFTKKYCSVHLSQHPNMAGQRQDGRITSYQGEGGWYLNKASFTYVLHREKGTNKNELIIENVRNKHTGGGETELENPVIIEWFPTSINIGYEKDIHFDINVIQNIKKML